MLIATKIKVYGLGLAVLSAALAPSACGGGDTGTGAGTATIGAGGSTSTGSGVTPCTKESVGGLWEEEGLAGGAIAIFNFDSGDDTYTEGSYLAPVAGSFDEELETGTYTIATVGTETVLTKTPQTLTCPSLDSPKIYGCAMAAGLLVLSTNDVGTSWAPNPQNVPEPKATTLGCLGAGGISPR